jgi:hypothetical protein
MEKGEHGITFPLDVILSSPSNKGAMVIPPEISGSEK